MLIIEGEDPITFLTTRLRTVFEDPLHPKFGFMLLIENEVLGKKEEKSQGKTKYEKE